MSAGPADIERLLEVGLADGIGEVLQHDLLVDPLAGGAGTVPVRRAAGLPDFNALWLILRIDVAGAQLGVGAGVRDPEERGQKDAGNGGVAATRRSAR